MIRPFVLLSTQRSGSTWVIDMLNSHPSVVAYSELLLEGASGRPKWGGAKDLDFWNDFYEAEHTRRSGIARRELLFRYLDSVYAPRGGCSAIGFKLMYGQLGAFPELHDYMWDRDVAVVHLIRENPIDILLSKEIAVRRQVFHARGKDPLGRIKVSLDIRGLLSRLEAQQADVERARAKFSTSDLPYLEIVYEELMSDAGQFGPVLELLGVDPAPSPLSSSLQKLNRAAHREVIDDYEAVAEVLVGTHFQRFLR